MTSVVYVYRVSPVVYCRLSSSVVCYRRLTSTRPVVIVRFERWSVALGCAGSQVEDPSSKLPVEGLEVPMGSKVTGL